MAKITPIDQIIKIATHSLIANLETVGHHRYLTAGRQQFRSLWVRDFCYSVPALLQLGFVEEVKNQIQLFLDYTHPSKFLVPRSLDSVSTKWRVVRSTLCYLSPQLCALLKPTLSEPLKPEYRGEHGTPSFDSNLLLVLAAIRYLENSKDTQFWETNQKKLRSILLFYKKHLQQHLIHQPPFSDWQDSARRAGISSYLNLLWWYLSHYLEDKPLLGPISIINAQATWEQIVQSLLLPNTMLLKNTTQDTFISLDSQLLALEFGFYRNGLDPLRAWHELITSPLFNDYFPYRTTYPDYPLNHISWTTRLIGLRHYHDRLCWSWLIALAYKMAQRFKELKVLSKIEHIFFSTLLSDQIVGEIYEFNGNRMKSWGHRLFQSEAPFSWGAAALIEALGSPLRSDI